MKRRRRGEGHEVKRGGGEAMSGMWGWREAQILDLARFLMDSSS